MGGGREVDTEGGWYRGQRVFRLRDGVRATALHKVGREDGGRRRPQCAGRVSNLEPTIGLPTWYQERPGSAKIHRDGMYVGGRYASPCLFYLFFRLLFSYPSFFRSLPRRAKGGQAYIRFRRVSYVSRRTASRSYFFLSRPPCMHASRRDNSTCRYFMESWCFRSCRRSKRWKFFQIDRIDPLGLHGVVHCKLQTRG